MSQNHTDQANYNMVCSQYQYPSPSSPISNFSLCFTSSPSSNPFYHSANATLIAGISDPLLTLAGPIIAYWASSLFFHFLDSFGSESTIQKYRIHQVSSENEKAEMEKKNLVSRSQVIWAVIFQQIVQTVLGLFWLEDDAHGEFSSGGEYHVGEMHRIAKGLVGVLGRLGLGSVLGLGAGKETLGFGRVLEESTWWVYWWVIPAAQLLFAMFIIDTWQYFLHRLMHVNKFLYRHFHSWHHRLYVPYAYGALYNHPVEGFLLDSLGAVIAESLTGMNTRQALVLFVVSTLKTVDDHCGYRLPWDPLQMITSNNADYHDIHHQVIGIKSNFSQPFFIHWDALLGTRMTRKDMEMRRQKSKAKAKKLT